MRHTAYVVGAYVPHGGTLMAYHIGRVLDKAFDYNVIAVSIADDFEPSTTFRYPDRYPSINLTSLANTARPGDLAIINPSYSDHLLGIALKCRKICYVQHFNTYRVIDGFFDNYISVSKPVAKFLRQTYNLKTRVIHPFIEPPTWDVLEWNARSSNVLLLPKGGKFAEASLSTLMKLYERKYGQLDFEITQVPKRLPHSELLALMQNHKFCLNLSPCEGFGLMPLEAMSQGCCIIGFDSVGGRDYMRDGSNCEISTYPDLERLSSKLHRTLHSERLQARLRTKGPKTAGQYTKDRFYSEWKKTLQAFI